MKLIYSELQKFLPDLNKEPQILRDDLTMIGHFTNFYEEIEGEIVFDLDIKVNRGDCLGYYGLARDLSVFYNINLVKPTPTERHCEESSTKQSLQIKIISPDVLRLQAIKLSGIKNLSSPDWLKKILKIHKINSINTLVDLTNYIMLFWGIPNHAFDTAKTGDDLVWENCSKPVSFTTLDGTKLNIPKDSLLITNHQTPLSLSFIGGQNSGINTSTTQAIIEMAIYNPSRVRTDWRSLKTVTEAALRLEKQLDCQTIPLAFSHLIQLICENTQATVSANLFDYYPQPATLPSINFDLTQPSKVSGINIPNDFCLDVFTRLGCQTTQKSPLSKGDLEGFLITPPSIRPDIEAEEDLVEEVVRFFGYQNIPTNQPITPSSAPNITPKIIHLIEKLKDELISLGYDEILTWPLIQKTDNPKAIYTQNSINSEYPVLRPSIIPSLQNQADQYRRYKLPILQFFEVGKVYYQENDQYFEKYSLGIFDQDDTQLQSTLTKLGLTPTNSNTNCAEIIIDSLTPPDTYTPSPNANSAIELVSQIITLDANVNYDTQQKPLELITLYSQKIDSSILWQIVITDEYHDKLTQKYRYTFRVSYYNCDDKTAKAVHLKTFEL